MADSPTYVFNDDGSVHVFANGKQIAVASNIDQLAEFEQRQAAPPGMPGPGGPPPGAPPMGPDTPPDAPPEEDPASKGIEVEFKGTLTPTPSGPPPGAEPGPEGPGDPLPGASPDTLPGDSMPPRATHIITPNGLKGQILGKTKGLWSDQVTIRLENGRIAKFDVTADSAIEYVAEGKTASSPYARMQEVLDADTDPTRSGLKRRIAELKVVKQEAQSSFRTASYVDETTLHNFIVEADAQIGEAMDAIEHMDNSTPYAPPEPQVFEQESMGGNDSTWLDNTLQEMIQEAEATDFDQVMEEQPEVMVAEMETPSLEYAQGVQEHALSYVRTRTAGLDQTAVAEFTKEFLARVEAARVAELEMRTNEINHNHSMDKNASVDDGDGPAEGLFW